MRRAKLHIIYTWIVLFCFAAGQMMVYTHQHWVKYKTHQTAQNQTTVSEKCQICDAMHHTSMTLPDNHYFIPTVSSDHVYKQGKYDFISISLILSAGRSPPVS
ncbi:MAG TPA: hypothetical protein VL442_04030 [Mucilaginibacter sp.]|nr:hypothetical protein [Mucilaginibacter sp.]